MHVVRNYATMKILIHKVKTTMKNKSLGIGIVIVAVAVLGYAWTKKSQPTNTDVNTLSTGEDANASPAPSQTPSQEEVKEFTMTSFYEMVDDKPKTQFSLKEITVKKGDTVRIKVTNTKGAHDFVIDEYNIKKETPLNEEVVIEFTADKAGEFVYYCSKPNHRAWGQWGTLKVTE